MKNKKTSFLDKFQRLYKEAVEDGNLFDSEADSSFDDFDIGEEDFDTTDEVGGESVTITLTQDQVSCLRDILSQVDGGVEDELGEEEDFSDDEFSDVSDIEELEKEAVEFENAPDAESARSRTKTGKAADNTGDLPKETQSQDTEEKQYKFVKREKPQELKHKTTKGS